MSDAPPVWDDPERFASLLDAAGWRWADALRWLGVAPTVGFFQVPAGDRERVAGHLGRLATDRKYTAGR